MIVIRPIEVELSHFLLGAAGVAYGLHRERLATSLAAIGIGTILLLPAGRVATYREALALQERQLRRMYGGRPVGVGGAQAFLAFWDHEHERLIRAVGDLPAMRDAERKVRIKRAIVTAMLITRRVTLQALLDVAAIRAAAWDELRDAGGDLPPLPADVRLQLPLIDI